MAANKEEEGWGERRTLWGVSLADGRQHQLQGEKDVGKASADTPGGKGPDSAAEGLESLRAQAWGGQMHPKALEI